MLFGDLHVCFVRDGRFTRGMSDVHCEDLLYAIWIARFDCCCCQGFGDGGSDGFVCGVACCARCAPCLVADAMQYERRSGRERFVRAAGVRARDLSRGRLEASAAVARSLPSSGSKR